VGAFSIIILGGFSLDIHIWFVNGLLLGLLKYLTASDLTPENSNTRNRVAMEYVLLAHLSSNQVGGMANTLFVIKCEREDKGEGD
jgi:hypothetical protein